MRWTRYLNVDFDAVPVHWGVDRPGDDDIMEAGFDPGEEELAVGRLTGHWEGHPTGALVISEVTVEGSPLAVQMLH